MKKINWEKTKIWEGAMLASITHAVMVAHFPELDYEHSWDGINYNTLNENGVRGTITFHPDYLIAAFRNEEIHSSNQKEAKDYLAGAKSEIVAIAESETFQYLLDDVNGETKPVITTAIWGETDLFSLDDENEINEKTSGIFKIQTKSLEEGLSYWEEYYEMNEEQVALVKQLFKEKMKYPTKLIILTEEQKKQIGTDDKEGLEQSHISFNEINVVLP